ncbi:MAG: hypothetical protein ABFD64_02835 [Armatimonadota bacterium]
MVDKRYFILAVFISLVVGWVVCSIYTTSGAEYDAKKYQYQQMCNRYEQITVSYDDMLRNAKNEQSKVELMLAENNRILAANERVLQQIDARKAQGY